VQQRQTPAREDLARGLSEPLCVLLHYQACEGVSGLSGETDQALTVFGSRKLYGQIQPARAEAIELLMVAWRAIHDRFTDDSRQSIWLTHIQVQHCLDHARKRLTVSTGQRRNAPITSQKLSIVNGLRHVKPQTVSPCSAQNASLLRGMGGYARITHK